MREHGQIATEGLWKGARWCATHGRYHGPLHLCAGLPAAVQEQIQADQSAQRTRLTDPEWLQAQRDKGVPPALLDLLRPHPRPPEG